MMTLFFAWHLQLVPHEDFWAFHHQWCAPMNICINCGWEFKILYLTMCEGYVWETVEGRKVLEPINEIQRYLRWFPVVLKTFQLRKIQTLTATIEDRVLYSDESPEQIQGCNTCLFKAFSQHFGWCDFHACYSRCSSICGTYLEIYNRFHVQ